MCSRHAVLLTSFKIFPSYPVTFSPLQRPRKSFSCNTYVFPVNVANKRLTVGLSPLDATLTKNTGGRVSNFPIPYSLAGVPVSLPHYFHASLPRGGAPRAACYTVPPMARQRLGQHFLADLHWREEIARAIRVSPHSTVPLPRDDQHCWIEIGSGHGQMYQHLLAVVPGDILKADLAAIASGRRMRIYGNLPYYITSPILHHLFTFAGLIDEIQ